MIISYRVKTPVSVSGAITAVGGTYGDGTHHKVRVYAFADIPGVGRVYSSGYVESAQVTITVDDSLITWTTVPASNVNSGNEPHYDAPTGYLYLKYDDNESFPANFDRYVEGLVSPSTFIDIQYGDWTAGNPRLFGVSELVYAITPQADVPRQSALSTNAAIEALAISIARNFGAIATAISSGNTVYSGHGVPNGTQVGNPGDLYTDLDTAILWTKQSGAATNTGWVV